LGDRKETKTSYLFPLSFFGFPYDARCDILASMALDIGPLRASDIRQQNEKIVLRLIHDSGARGISQSEVVLTTGLKAPTIFRIFSFLEESGYIEPIESAPKQNEEVHRQEKRGRRPVVYRAKADARYVLGIEFHVERISLGVFDFLGNQLYARDVPLNKTEDALAVVHIIVDLASEAISHLKLDKTRILGIGVGAPGQVNVGSRLVASYPRIPGMRNFPIATILEKELGLPVVLHNNCSVLAKSQCRYGEIGHEESLFMFLLRTGVNGAFVDKGKVFLSPQGTTIEMGHISIDYDGPNCVCGARGCLEAFMTALDTENLSKGHWLFEELNLEDYASAPILDSAASYLSSAVQTVSRLFRPASYLVVARSEPLASALASRMSTHLSKELSTFDDMMPHFIGRAYDASLALRGAADLVIDSFLS